MLFEELKNSPEKRERLRGVIPALVAAAEKQNFDEFCEGFVKERENSMAQQRAMLDPLSAEGQRLIAEQIQRANIDFSHQFAMEHMPEAYVPVTMLYINMKINGQPVKAFVDSGIVHGVGGVQKLVGKIHTCQVQVESNFFPCNFDVLADRDIDVLLGLDILKRHECVIDLKNRCLRFGDSTVTSFLNEADIPKRDLDKAASSPSSSSANALLNILENGGYWCRCARSEDCLISVEVDSAKLASLMSLGFEEAASRAMLIQCGNDLELAAANLLARQTAQS
ncbi:unnamed protein product [Anisakis simplex]|uniref:Protein DDI1 homolog 2 (inferred by orthology to a zebrafish protein) n=1 Tax=Anisakis simplex TaxID=6269 RepID=A0A0M3K8G3_ANISI|nr:unnamed protein product [Anisakis simplex]